RLRGGGSRTLRSAIGTAVLTAAIAPVLWSSCVLVPGGGGSASDAYAGPRIASASFVHGPGGPGASRGRHGSGATAAGPTGIPALRRPWFIPPDPQLTAEQRHLIDVVRAGSPGSRVLFATDSLPVAETVIVQTPYDAMPMGGFSRLARTPTLDELRAALHAGTTSYVLLVDAPEPPNPTLDAVRQWVRSDCRPVMRGTYRAGSPQVQALFDCAAAAR
ncbi:hypothetical protein, partial [Mesorhizobium japonicum]|uniref:hypothetical protein n=1 Tax=Mesorhizobium japonicum TaxID=2066070 RepID=UPI003B5BA25C